MTTRPFTRISWSVTVSASTSPGGCTAEESGSLMVLLWLSTCTSDDELTIRKNTRIVKMSISDTRFILLWPLFRLWWRFRRRALADSFMIALLLFALLPHPLPEHHPEKFQGRVLPPQGFPQPPHHSCLLYTSDAADDLLCV